MSLPPLSSSQEPLSPNTEIMRLCLLAWAYHMFNIMALSFRLISASYLCKTQFIVVFTQLYHFMMILCPPVSASLFYIYASCTVFASPLLCEVLRHSQCTQQCTCLRNGSTLRLPRCGLRHLLLLRSTEEKLTSESLERPPLYSRFMVWKRTYTTLGL